MKRSDIALFATLALWIAFGFAVLFADIGNHSAAKAGAIVWFLLGAGA